ncbi:bifunctional phosphoribosylaminoimidazolecarboxamide formyltransferase/IMP cyclohydrolase [Parasphaerochaeta coccoides]|uniref:Bifunctional purine biosynthesis protein PurH n=1 Tax=Parasphaerochaeta coccoides (strain ATCC BAA-1237 / DSM 17374 / SPN1) TaxID=760011 RepID=F4GLD3_PARC1|nr:bifunctional phosphoribosylaminoimidazolecarboxamide formyltransferase/IMP cyclohydrolase [Parasphaerochaeta coccoides]AEC02965.1 IMP cyclohydrolase; phosphoribosylaminoimidazolecarboxamide formyltransferase [Parasphaerochaeta coccoides DSM 17374]
MNKTPVTITRALLSVSDKSGLLELAEALHDRHVELISTGGTAHTLRKHGLPVKDVAEITCFPEMMDGRVKTLHPLIHGGILGLRDDEGHVKAAKDAHIGWIDLVVCNLYPFEKTINKPGVELDEAIENIDIGGPSMIRAAAKNMGWTAVLTSPDQYPAFIEEFSRYGQISFASRRELTAAAFRHTAQYDTLIQSYLTDEPFPETLSLTWRKSYPLRYGENPHQTAAVYQSVEPPTQRDGVSLLDAKVLNGKELSYNNLNDADGAVLTVREFTAPACVVVKHATPCGVSISDDIATAVDQAFMADELSAYGGIVAINRPCTVEVAKYFSQKFIEVFLAPSYEEDALEVLRKKKALRVLALGDIPPLSPHLVCRPISGGLLVQERDMTDLMPDDVHVVTKVQPTSAQLSDLLFGWKVIKHVRSNAILLARDTTTVGIGGGQVSRVDAVKIAISKAKDTHGAVLVSDAFFPFRDSIDVLKGTGITAVIQPGGSIRDQEVIDACDEAGIAMVFTGGIRGFLH